ncbi:MAG: hypothetical protein HQK79_15590 [Desulfobacterales bacterium]|nr:hypothetical protein [Desulfobacterales bacterium]MBF0395684.1 hypothetical protein [Desulfobacterales bacterium]
MLLEKPLNLTHENYIEYCLKIAEHKLSSYTSISEIAKDEDFINIYENIKFLEEPKDISILDEDDLTKDDYKRAVKCILEGRFFTEHAAAGEATRLGIGTKYMINMQKDLPIEKIAELMSKEKGATVTANEVLEKSKFNPNALLPFSLGKRHMLELSFDISKLAKANGYNPEHVLSKQKMLIIVNEVTGDLIINEFIASKFFGFNPSNVFFMVQKPYHGISFFNGRFFYDTNSSTRLHNHGQMVIQETMDDELFYVDDKGNKRYLKSDEFGEILKNIDNKISYNIEDLEYLINSIEHLSLAFALKKSDEGYRMLMEIVGNDPINPQKGGMAAFDSIIGRNVMIEGFQLKGIKNHEIKYLNKNFNQYLKPYEAWFMLKKHGLNMPIAVKNGYIYFQPVQGDINFLVKTLFFRRKVLKPIKAWKSPATTPLAIYYMSMQDKQVGFREYAEAF